MPPSSSQSLESFDELSVTDGASAAPHLYLGPRVATLVRDVFGDEPASGESFKPAGGPLGTGLAPLAESSNRDDPALALDNENDDAADAETYSPLRIHREMYRTDI